MIYGREIGLSPLEAENLPLLVPWRNDPYTQTMFLTPFLVSYAGQSEWYGNLWTDPTRMQFLIVRLNDNQSIGTIGLHHIDYRHQEAEFGPLWLDPMQRGLGLAPDAARTLIGYAFQELNLHRLYAPALDYNRSIQRMAAMLGFKREGVARKAIFSNGEFHDLIRFAILREEWQDDDV